MIIAVAGDIHGDIHGWYKWILAWQERTGITLDAVLHVGDFGVYLPTVGYEYPESVVATSTSDFKKYWEGRETVPIPTWVCPGNHEDYAALMKWQQAPNKIPNLHLLPDGGITDVKGMKVGSVWGNFSFKSWFNPERVITARRQHAESNKAMHITKAAVERLKALGAFDVLITHDAPAKLMKTMKQPPDIIKQRLGMDSDERAQGCPGFNELYKTGNPKAHFFGHFHTYYVCQEKDPLVVCLHCFHYNPAFHLWVTEFDPVLEDFMNVSVLSL